MMMANKLSRNLTPNQYYVTQAAGNDRPFTGDMWQSKDVGVYSCLVCTQRLFMFEHKYLNKSGYPTFWNALQNSVAYKVDAIEPLEVQNAHVDPTLKNKTPARRCVCSNVSNFESKLLV